MWGLLIDDNGCEPECFDTREEAIQHLFEHAAEYSQISELRGEDCCSYNKYGDLEFNEFTYRLEEMVTRAGDLIDLTLPHQDGGLAIMQMAPEQALRLAATLITAVAGTKPMQAHQTAARAAALEAAARSA
jgi:hypothetical protein